MRKRAKDVRSIEAWIREIPMNYEILYKTTALAAMICLTGCTTGPDFKRPVAPAVEGYLSTPLAAHTANALESPRVLEGGWRNPHWWQEFASPKLDNLIDDALHRSPTLAGSLATLRQAQELYAAQTGSTRYPQVAANAGIQRQRSSSSASGMADDSREFSLYNAGVGVKYNLDLAGGNRRAAEALLARADYQQYQVDGARLTLIGNIVTSAITQARLSEQIQTTETILRIQEEQLGLTREKIRLGQAAPDDVLAMQTLVEQTRAGIPLLRNQLQQNNHLLAVLAGRAPGEKELPSFALDEFTLPNDLPLIVPSDLVRVRSDIQAAEALLHAANAEYGVAIANLYPQINLSADLGSQALTTGALFGGNSMVWSLVGQLTQPLFNPGLPAKKRATLAAFDAAAANYQTVVLESLREVADVLRALENDSQRLTALSAADLAAQKLLDSMRRRYDLGATSYFELLTVEQQSQQTKIDLIEVQAQRFVNCAAFYQAMGAGGNATAAVPFIGVSAE